MNRNLSDRLLAVADMVDENDVVYDVGCDHAYLDIYLNQMRHIECYAIDIKKSVVERAKHNIAVCNLDIPVLLNNGIDNIILKPNAVVVLAGMGTKNILKILENKDVPKVIVQSNDDIPLLREKVCEKGYSIIEEKVTYDNKYFYVTIKFFKYEANYSYKQLLLGPKLMNNLSDPVYIKYLRHWIRKIDKMLNDIPDQNSVKKIQLLKNRDLITEYLDQKNDV